MKLDCAVVEDLYPLFMENEVKQETRVAIKKHLESCPNCSRIYEEGAGFTGEFAGGGYQEENVPDSLDDKIRLKIKLIWMRIVAVGLVLIILVSAINNYIDNRRLIADRFNDVYRYSEDLTFLAQHPQEMNAFTSYQLSYSQEKLNDFTENLNWLEKRKLQNSWLNVESGGLEKMINTLVKRQELGLQDETDRQALAELKTNLDSLHKEIQAQYRLFHHGYSSYLELVDVEKFANEIAKINKTIYFYTRHHLTSAEAELLSEDELEKRIRDVLGFNNGKLELKQKIDQPVMYGFKLENKGLTINGEINSFTGYIIDASSHSETVQENLDSIDYNELEENARDILERQYGEDADFQLDYREGFNGIQDQSYFDFIPVVDGYEFFFQYDLKNTVVLNHKTGEFSELRASSIPVGPEFFSFKPEEKIKKDKAEQIATKDAGKQVKYKATQVIYSPLAGGYVLAHIFEGDGEEIFIDANSGMVVDAYYM
ncbi:zf-HC2 domain-containing protein [Bacillus sp. EB01]|uniref:zf-HC2 domain-containing protein n=1 Tax=Bacillus sp. EB01 TaxID=1347086 RepID=UPI0005C5AA4D|nr:zf-HC2 domain-containing protein [Bacillus sp. EB01]